VNVIGVMDCWYRVRTAMDRVGYVFCDFLTFDAQAAASGAAVTRSAPEPVVVDLTEGEKIVEYAKQYMGTPYVYGGASPSGFDCSGFVSYVLKNNGYAPTRTSYSLYDQYPHIEKSSLQIGDLVFFSSYSSWGAAHVGIYIGNNEFIHSSSGSGYVKINNLDDNYYALHYIGAGRYMG
jgi:cell wall-associated NlpC family hydrolase